MKPRWTFMIKLFTSLGLIGLVLYFVDYRELLNITLYLDRWYLLLVIVGLLFFDRVLMAYKWNQLLRAVDIRVPFSRVFLIYTTARLPAIFLSSSVGADLFRIHGLSAYKVN